MHARPALVALLAAALVSVAGVSRAESGPRWADLSGAQRAALAPLQGEWASIDADRKQKWLQIAGRFPTMPPSEQSRIQARMAE